MDKADVVIIGGGIAGLAVAATLCSDSNLAVVLVEKNGIGANRTTPVVFSDIVEEYGLKDSIEQYYTGYVFHSPLGAKARFDYDQSALASLKYHKACKTLFDTAAGNGLELINARAVKWSPEIPDADQTLRVHLDNGENIQTQLLIDASGHTQWAAKQLHLRLSPYCSVCYGEFITGCSFEDSSTFYFLAPSSRYGTGGGWFYPIKESSASLGYAMLVQDPLPSETVLLKGYLAAKQEFRPYADWVKDSVTQRVEGGIIPVGRISRFVEDRILIVGDAAGQANPWSMMGTNTGLSNGRLCAQVVLKAFDQKRFDRSTLSSFEQQWAESNRKTFDLVENIVILDFMHRSDRDWDKFTSTYNSLSADTQLRYMRDYPSSVFHKAYEKAGAFRRRFSKLLGI